jgi:hypothetical protein
MTYETPAVVASFESDALLGEALANFSWTAGPFNSRY